MFILQKKLSIKVFAFWLFLASFFNLLLLSDVYPAQAALNSWSSGSPASSFISVAVSPNFVADQTVLAGGASSGLWKSTDGGNSWSQIGFNGLYVTAIAYSPDFVIDNTVFFTTSTQGVYKSTDGGGSWTTINNGLGSLKIRTLVISPSFSSDQTVFAATISSGVYKTTDGGNSWIKASTGLSESFILALAISPNYSVDNTLFAGGWFLGLYKSTDGGSNWTRILSGGGVTAITFSPNYATDKTVFIGRTAVHSLKVLKSVDEGASWINVSTGLPPFDTRALSISPNFSSDTTLYAAFYGGGVYQSTDGGNSWLAFNNGLTNLYVQAFAQENSVLGVRNLFAATKSGVFAYSEDKVAPTISNLQPPDNGIVTTSSPEISANYSDIGSEIDTTTVKLYVDGIDVTAMANVSTSTITSQSSGLSERIHNVQLDVSDRGGNLTSASWSFTVDTIAPTIYNQQPPDGSRAPARPNISAQYNDNGVGIDVSTVKLYLDSQDVTPLSTVTNSMISYTPASPLARGLHLVMVIVADRAANLAQSVWSFIVGNSK